MDEVDRLIRDMARLKQQIVSLQECHDRQREALKALMTADQAAKPLPPFEGVTNKATPAKVEIVEGYPKVSTMRLMERYHSGWLDIIPHEKYQNIVDKPWRNDRLLREWHDSLRANNGKRTGRVAVRIAAIVAMIQSTEDARPAIVKRFQWLGDARLNKLAITPALMALADMEPRPHTREGWQRLVYMRAMDAFLDVDTGAKDMTQSTIPTDHQHIWRLAGFGELMARRPE